MICKFVSRPRLEIEEYRRSEIEGFMRFYQSKLPLKSIKHYFHTLQYKNRKALKMFLSEDYKGYHLL